jgi:MSHA biogenesis protein MshE
VLLGWDPRMRNINKIRERPIGRILLEEGMISHDQLDEIRAEHEAHGEPFAEVALRVADITEWELMKVLVKHLHMPFIYPTRYAIPKEINQILPSTFVHQHRMVVLDLFEKTLVVACSGDLEPGTIEEIERTTGYEVSLYLALPSEIGRCLDEHFPLGSVAKEVAARLDQLFGS